MNAPANQKQILYVDDEPQALKYFSRLFEDRFDIVTAESVDAAMECLQNHADNISVVVTDQRMPEKSGVQLMELIRFQYPNIARILLTAYSELELAIQSVNEGGAFRYLKKPLDEDEMIGTLLRAQEYHAVLDERDQLLREKLTVLHRLIVMDRVRGLATATTALEGRLNNAWRALTAYMQQSPVKQRIQVQMDEISGMNMIAVARREAELMVRTVEMILQDTIEASSGGSQSAHVPRVLAEFVAKHRSRAQDDDVAIETVTEIPDVEITTDQGMLMRLLEIVLRRLSDIQDQPTQIDLSMSAAEGRLSIAAKGSFGKFQNGHVASLFAAAIPLQKWPIGLDMDLLSAFMIAHHLGGSLTIEPTSPLGPGLRLEIPLVMPEPEKGKLDSAWFETVYESLEDWENEMIGSM